MADTDTAASGPREAVLDTNVVLDWLVFDEMSVRPLARRIEAGLIVWLTTADMLAEFRHVVGRWSHPRCLPDREQLDRKIERWAMMTTAPQNSPAGLRCRDSDDQKFLDLVHARPAAWLFTRDRDLLVLRRRAARAGLRLLRPDDWRVGDQPD